MSALVAIAAAQLRAGERAPFRVVTDREPSAGSSNLAKSGPTGSVRVLGWRGSDEELLERLRSGHPGAAAMLHDRFAPEVNRMVWRVLGADQDHDDIVQQVFCKLLVNAPKVREAEKLRGWVQSVTVNTVYSELRKRGVRRLFRRTESLAPEPATETVQDAESRDLLTRIHAELNRMPAGERLAFTLRFVEEKPLAEVAELCNCSLATIKRRLQKANKRFQAFAERYPEVVARFRQQRNSGDGDLDDADFDDSSWGEDS